MDESTFDVGDFNDLLDNITSQAAPWVSAFTGTPVVATPASPGAAALQQARINQQAQANYIQQNPNAAGFLSQPVVILLAVGGLLVLLLVLFFALRK